MSFLAIMAYVMSGLTIVVVNKCIVRDSGLHAPALVSSMGALFTAALTRFMVFIGKVEVREIDLTPLEFAIWRAFPVGAMTAGSLVFGNMSYIYLDAGFIQMLKAGTPALLMLVLYVCKIETISPMSGTLAMSMVGGSLVASLQQPNVNMLGMAIQLVSQVCEVFQCTAVQIFLQKRGFEAWDAGFYLAPAVASCCLVTSLIMEWPALIADQQVWLLFDQLPLLMMSGAVGVVVNLSSLLVIKFTSSLMAKLLVIVRSSALVLFFFALGEDFTWIQVGGYAFTIVAFTGYSIVKAHDMEKAEEDKADKAAKLLQMMEEGKSPEEQALVQAGVTIEEEPAKMREAGNFSDLDLTSGMFWFAFLIVLASAYQAFVLGEIKFPVPDRAFVGVATPGNVPPVPYMPLTSLKQDIPLRQKQALLASSVESSAKVLYLEDGRFLARQGSSVLLTQRDPEDYLSSSWLISSSEFGAVQLRAYDSDGDFRWLSCDFALTYNQLEACNFWMAASSFDHWETDEAGSNEFILNGQGPSFGNLSVAAKGDSLSWSSQPQPFQVANWLPESCSLRGMQPADEYASAKKQVTITMLTNFTKQAHGGMFRQALSSVFEHLKDRRLYVKEVIVVDEWYDGRSEALNGTLTGPTSKEAREQMLAFFPGCKGSSTAEAGNRSSHCSFVFKEPEEKGQARSLNLLTQLMDSEFWLHLDDHSLFYQDFYLSRMLQPFYEEKEHCERVYALAHPTTTTTTESTTPSPTTTTSMATVEQVQYFAGAREAPLPTMPAPKTYSGYGDEDGGSEFQDEEAPDWQEQPGRQRGSDFRGHYDLRTYGQRRLHVKPDCQEVAGVSLALRPADALKRSETPYVVEKYVAPEIVFNATYVHQLLRGGVDEEIDNRSELLFEEVGVAHWPLVPLRPALFNLTYIKSLEAPLFEDEARGIFAEDTPNFDLEFLTRWARGGAAFASLTPGTCMLSV